MSYITTYSGLHFDPTEPDKELIDIKDITHALSLLCRANGHFRHFYSVAQHSTACAREADFRGLSNRVVMGCLLHDGSEAYLSDVTRPVKEGLPHYLETEARLQDMIWEKYLLSPITEEEKYQVFLIDDQMLSLEFHALMPEDIDEEYLEIKTQPDFSFRLPDVAEREFLELFTVLYEKLTSSPPIPKETHR